MDLLSLSFGLGLGVLVAVLARAARALNRSGAWAAALVGAVIFGLGGLAWAVLLLTFFISSSVLSVAFRSRKAGLHGQAAKGSHRDWGQVLANGGLGALLAALSVSIPGRTWIWIAYAGAMAAVNADTWATEIGILSPSRPRRIVDGNPVPPGTSGAITWVGSLAALAGALLIGLLAAALSPQTIGWRIIAPVAGAGLGAAMWDSLLGATVQGVYWCPDCAKETERHPVHVCGSPTTPSRGWRWLNNDWVNFSASVLGAGLAVALWGAG